jgi:hypothetical protein
MERVTAQAQGLISARPHDPVRTEPAPALIRTLFPAIMALMLGIFNPALCMLHCTITEDQTYRQAPFGTVRFVCHLHGAAATQPDAQTGMHDRQTTMPRAFYEGAITLLVLIVALVLISLLPPHIQLHRYGDAPQPPIPPPKSLHLCPSCALSR